MLTALSGLKGMRPWQAVVFLAVIVGLGGGGYVAYSGLGGSDEALAAEERLVLIEYGDLVNQVTSNGSIAFPNREVLFLSAQGTVATLLVSEGQEVTAGQELATLDEEAVASLQQTLARARVNLEQAEEALEELGAGDGQTDVGELDQATLASLTKDVAQARVTLLRSRDELDDARNPFTALVQARAERDVAAARLSLDSAQEVWEEASAGPTSADIKDARAEATTAEAALASALQDLAYQEAEHARRVAAALDSLTIAEGAYVDSLVSFLGIEPSDAELALDLDDLLTDWGIDLADLFSRVRRYDESSIALFGAGSINPLGPAVDDPATPWNELTVYTWINLFPGDLFGTCDGVTLQAADLCVRKELDADRGGYLGALGAWESAAATAAKATSNAMKAVDQASSSHETAQERLVDVLAGPSSLDVESKLSQVAVAQATLDEALEALAEAEAGADPLDVALRAAELASAEAAMERAEERLADFLSGGDPLEVALGLAELATSKAAVQTAEDRLDGAVLVAPFAGYVAAVNAEVGQSVGPNTPILEIVDPTVAEVVGVVDEIDVLQVGVGARALVTLDGLPGLPLVGIVATIGSSAVTQQGVVTYDISIQVQAPPGVPLREGLSATAAIVLRQETDVLLIPNAAIGGSFDAPFARVASDGAVEERLVVLGDTDGFWTVVRQGLAEGDRVVMEGQVPQAGGQSFTNFGGLGGGFGGGQQLSPEARQQFMQSLTPEQRNNLRRQFQQPQGGGGGGGGGGTRQ